MIDTFGPQCMLGEGPLWHPMKNALYYFDIIEKVMMYESSFQTFDEYFSAAGWVDEDTLLMASETGLWRCDITDGTHKKLVDLEANNTTTRSNDGRADPWGGFWIGTMGKDAQPQAGAIYRYYRGDLRKLVPDMTITNSICFAPDRSCAYYSDTATQKLMCQPLHTETGWPDGPASVFIDLTGTEFFPDGAVTDAAGNLWVAMWGASCVMCFAANSSELQRLDVPARQPTCPAFGGPELRDLYVTSAAVGLDQSELDRQPANGQVMLFKDVAQGVAEPQVIL